MSNVRKSILKMRRQSIALLSLALIVLVGAVIWIVPEMISSRAETKAEPKAAAVQHAPIDKDGMTTRLNQLAAEIDNLKRQVGTGQSNQSLQLRLNARIAEYDSISAQMGGDRAAPQAAPSNSPPPGPKDAAHVQMRQLDATITSLRQQLASDPSNQSLKQQLDNATNELKSISASLGGDLPAPAGVVAPRVVAPTPSGCTPTTTNFTNNTPTAIPTGPAVVTSTVLVSGAGSFLWEVDLTTFMPHTFAADLDVTLTSPAGTVVTLTTDNGVGNDNVFNGTLWDDQATTPITDFVFANNVVAAALQPEEAMGAFYGEDPNGTWTITISDDLAGDGGSLDSWTLGLTTLPTPPTETTTTFSNNTPTTIVDVATSTSVINVSGAGTTLAKITMTTNLAHTFAADLDVTLISPSGRVVTITTDNGVGNDNVFNGTVWDDAANPAGQVPYVTNNGVTTDHVYVNNTLASPLVVEGALGAFQGEDPNGNWTISITDDLAGDTGTLTSWSIDITTAACAGGGPCACTPQTFTNNTPVAIPTGPAVVTSTINVTGAGTSLLDVNLTTFMPHTFAADLDVTITSPAGTVVTLTTDNGVGNDNVFNGTVWDDDANPAGQVPYVTNNGVTTDHVFVNNTLASPLVPEEAMGAFVGENPNGTWTITISDDLAGDGGSLNSWSLDICSLATPPTSTTTSFTNNTPTAIPTGPAVVTSTVNVTGVGTQVGKITLLTNMPHTFAADLDVTIMSPAGTVVTLTTDNGVGNDNVFNGTLWDDDANPAGQVPYVTNNGVTTDHVFVNNTLASPLVPEEAMGAFVGEDPNGIWTITISDDLAGDGGSLDSWTLNVTTISCANPCTLTCPANVTASNDPNQCGAVVNYPPPTTSGGCTTVTCSPPSGSFFPVGTTTVTCTDASGPSCSFTITVNDTQPPTIDCPDNVTATTTTPGATTVVVTFADPVASDNCPGVTAACVPPSGSTFPVGASTVTCTATDTAGNTATCSFTITVFDFAIADPNNPTAQLLVDSQGNYIFCCGTTTVCGKGKVTRKGNILTIEHNTPTYRLLIKIDIPSGKADATLKTPPGQLLCQIIDRAMNDTAIGTCTTASCNPVPAASGKSQKAKAVGR